MQNVIIDDESVEEEEDDDEDVDDDEEDDADGDSDSEIDENSFMGSSVRKILMITACLMVLSSAIERLRIHVYTVQDALMVTWKNVMRKNYCTC